MKLLRFVVVAAVLAYAGWLAWPYLAPMLGVEPAAGPEAMRSAAEARPLVFGVLPWWSVLVAAIGLYVVAALMLGSGSSRAAVAYFLGFMADIALRLAIDGRSPGDLFSTSSGEPMASAARAAESGLPVDPLWLALGGLLVLGLLVIVASRRIRRKRLPGQFAY